MQTINRHIEYLLMHGHCVVIPGVGALYSHVVDAHFDKDAHMWFAPRLAVEFDCHTTLGDGALAASLMRRDGVDADTAHGRVRAYAAEINKCLKAGGAFGLGSVGMLEPGPGGMPRLVQSSLTPSGQAWLPAFAVAETAKKSLMPTPPTAAAASRGRVAYSRAMRAVQVAAVACILLLLGFVAKENLAYAPPQQLAAVGPVAKMQDEAQRNQLAPFRVILSKAPAAEVIENTPAVPDAPAYYVIVASFARRADADMYIAERGDARLGVLDFEGRYRVYAAKTADMAGAMDHKNDKELSASYEAMWICRK